MRMQRVPQRIEELLARRKTKPPARLFKYRDVATALATIQSLQVLWKPPAEFPDHLDCKWNPFGPTLTDDFRDKYLAEARRRLAGGAMDWGRIKQPKWVQVFGMERLKLQRLPEAERTARLDQMEAEMRENADSEAPRWHARSDDLIARLRVFCLCADSGSDRMWSEYADHHRGCILVFDTLALERHWKTLVKRVKYGDALPALISPEKFLRRQLGEEDPSLDAEVMQGAETWTLFKMRAYEHEAEWRFVRQEPRNTPIEVKRIDFPASALVEVIYGRECESSDRQRIEDALELARGGVVARSA